MVLYLTNFNLSAPHDQRIGWDGENLADTLVVYTDNVQEGDYHVDIADENGNIVGRRIFKMTPIHHHFELSGWKENKIVAVFSLVTCIAAAIGIAIAYFGIFSRLN